MPATIVDRFKYSADVGEFFDKNKRIIISYVRSIRPNPSDTADLVQEVAKSFLMYDTLARFDPSRGHLNTFISKSLRRACFNYLMKPCNRHPPVNSSAIPVEQFSDHAETTSDVVLDLLSFLKWYRLNGKTYRQNGWIVNKDIRVIKLALGGFGVKATAHRMRMTKQSVYAKLKFMRGLYDRFVRGDLT